MFTEIVKKGTTNPSDSTSKSAQHTILGDVKLGDTVSINGTCLTVTEFDVKSSDFIVGLAPRLSENLAKRPPTRLPSQFGESSSSFHKNGQTFSTCKYSHLNV
ncbi:hypothetical protein V2J09_013213 [Rumex salicifolius]